MKHFIKQYSALMLIAALAVAGSGCKKFLEQEPYNRLSVNDIFQDLDFQDLEGARTTLIGAYENLADVNYYERALGLYPELTGGNIKYARSSNQAFLNTYFFANGAVPDQNDLAEFYQTAYNTIYRANNMFAYIDRVADANQLQKNRLLAEAYSIRALCHFDLVRVFALPYNYTSGAGHAGIVLRTTNTGADAPVAAPNTVKQVYDRVIADLDSAILLYGNSVPVYAGGDARGYLSADAARALLLRVHLYREDWSSAVTLANQLIATGNYPLTPNSQYVDGWRRRAGNQMDREAIFYLFSRTDIPQGSFGDNFNPVNGIFGYMATSNDLLGLFEPGDVRRRESMFVQTAGFWYTRKYQGMNDSANNQKLFRISEVYLSRAEAQAELNNLPAALADLNTIRRRANPNTPLLNISSQQQVLDSIFVERRRELCFEGHLLFDIARKKRPVVRTDCTGNACNLPYPSTLFAVPIPNRR
ncbi:MAG: RagB/SusD family nutrient uptake outer membrane protein [Chitinophagaceae bacterium]|nr:RagB/SusD family nutrient uptake outer membrane protein [Chitinophagaceae bacterium]